MNHVSVLTRLQPAKKHDGRCRGWTRSAEQVMSNPPESSWDWQEPQSQEQAIGIWSKHEAHVKRSGLFPFFGTLLPHHGSMGTVLLLPSLTFSISESNPHGSAQLHIQLTANAPWKITEGTLIMT